MITNFDEPVAKRLARNLRRRREQLGLTQEAAAKRIGIVTRHLQKLEAGDVNVTLRTLVRVARGLRVDVSSFFEV